jgi:hypothetical protein
MTREELTKKLAVLYPPGSTVAPVDFDGDLLAKTRYGFTVKDHWELYVDQESRTAWFHLPGVDPHVGYLYVNYKGKEYYAEAEYPENYNYFNH